ncbi:MAG: ORF6N domain-containing protein [Deltaproteobacteria bacterium]|nr:ORF6N domain-containing protein [Deltaproteobacteria bacterium]
MTTPSTALVSADLVAHAILLIRGHRVMLDDKLAELYEVETRELVQAVKRNADRFPADFMFQLTPEEARALRSQSVILKTGRGQHRKYPPYAFTEQGVAMLSGVLHSRRAVDVNIAIMRAFVQLRSMLGANAELAAKLARLEKKYDAQFKVVFDAIRQLMGPGPGTKRRIGFAP